jgi:hypothetical protein
MAGKMKFKVGDWVLVPGNFPLKEHRKHWVQIIYMSGRLMTCRDLGITFDCTVDEIGAKRVLNTVDRYEILERDGFRCQLCGRTAQDMVVLEIDHKISYAEGGTTEDLDNLWTLCRDCNRGKGTRSL